MLTILLPHGAHPPATRVPRTPVPPYPRARAVLPVRPPPAAQVLWMCLIFTGSMAAAVGIKMSMAFGAGDHEGARFSAK